ncbi:hypothetical protein AAVH_39979, partial [Aphelenchoides avenae]
MSLLLQATTIIMSIRSYRFTSATLKLPKPNPKQPYAPALAMPGGAFPDTAPPYYATPANELDQGHQQPPRGQVPSGYVPGPPFVEQHIAPWPAPSERYLNRQESEHGPSAQRPV